MIENYELEDKEQIFDKNKYITIIVIGVFLYLAIYLIDIPLINNANTLILFLSLKVLAYTIILIGLSIIIFHYFNLKLKESKIMLKLVMTRITIIILTIAFVVMGLVDKYSSSLCTGFKESNYLSTVGYIYDCKEIFDIMFKNDYNEYYQGRVTLSTKQDSFSTLFGNSVQNKKVYYLKSENNYILGVLSREDLERNQCLDYINDREYSIVYCSKTKLIKSIELK